MSQSFRMIQNPPLYKDWKVWVKNSSVTEGEIDSIKAFIDVTDFSEDIINTIAYFLFVGRYISFEKNAYTPEKWNYNLYDWLEYWCGNPIEHQLNPLCVVKNSFEIMNPNYIKKLCVDQCAVIMHKSIDYIGNVQVNLGSGTRSINLGISFPRYDVSNIKKCTMLIDNVKLRSKYIFDDNNCLKVQWDGASHKFYYNPKFKVIPSSLLSFSNIIFRLELFNENETPKIISMLNVFSCLPDSCVNLEEYHVNVDDPHHHMIIKGGKFEYKW